jgi:nucleotide-binding universal stress UspA family protein
MVPPGGRAPDEIRTLLVPVEGSPGARLALALAVGLARTAGAGLLLLEAVPPIPDSLYGVNAFLGRILVDPSWDEETLARAQSYVDGLAERLRADGLAAEGLAQLGTEVETIVRVAEERSADVIVMGTHASTGPSRALLGSVADAVVRTAQRPVLLMRLVPREQQKAAERG